MWTSDWARSVGSHSKGHRVTLLLALTSSSALFVHPLDGHAAEAQAQDLAGSVPGIATLRDEEFTVQPAADKKAPPKREFQWIKPRNVRYALLVGCGGGAGGNGGAPRGGVQAGQKLAYRMSYGGDGAPVMTRLAGPLTKEVYTVTLGTGGKGSGWGAGGHAGGVTTFVGEDMYVAFRGADNSSVTKGASGSVSASDSRGQTRAQDSDYTNAKLPAQGGAIGARRDNGGGGGGAGLQGGGAGGNDNQGGAAGGLCAGGGGGAASGPGGVGGDGGDGYLRVVPLVDGNAFEAQLQNAVRALTENKK